MLSFLFHFKVYRVPRHLTTRNTVFYVSFYGVQSPTPPHYVFWYHNGQILNFLRNRPDFTITLEPQTPLVEVIDGIDGGLIGGGGSLGGGGGGGGGTGVASISRLQMKHAEDRHSGNYTCMAPKTRPASTLVFVTEGTFLGAHNVRIILSILF